MTPREDPWRTPPGVRPGGPPGGLGDLVAVGWWAWFSDGLILVDSDGFRCVLGSARVRAGARADDASPACSLEMTRNAKIQKGPQHGPLKWIGKWDLRIRPMGF